jgi:hypothetical protein
MLRKLGTAAILLGACLWTGTAAAFCRTTTCDAVNPNADCNYDPVTGCATKGNDLFWPSRCTWFGVQKDGSNKVHISADTFHTLIAAAFAKWEGARCTGGTHPSVGVQDTNELYGPAVCNQQEYNEKAANANVWMFRDDSWPYPGGSATIALTTLTIDTISGQILDADVEVNSYGTPNITTSDTHPGSDLESIVTHESGHFLGLAHSRVADSTMYAQYTPTSLDIRTLAPDDEAGICAIYPPADGVPACPEPEPLSGFSLYCGGVNPLTQPVPVDGKSSGCTVGRSGETSGWPYAALLGLLVVRRRRPARLDQRSR